MYETSNAGKYQPVVIGIDHGFSLIKSYHHIMSNGVAKTSGRPPVLENSLYYDGNYYVIGGSRMTVNEDKTESDNYFILTLAAIAKELKTRGIEKFAKVVLGVGVPFKRFGEEQANLVDYLTRSGLIAFEFEGQEFTIVIQKVICYPQSFAAIADRISNMEGRYVVADIGSWTKDIVCIDNKRINVEQSVTISHSIITLFQSMNSAIYAKTGKRIPEDILQDFILGKEVILSFDVKEIIERQLMEFAHKTEGQLNEYGFDIDYSNVIYVGGVDVLTKKRVTNNGIVPQYYVENNHEAIIPRDLYMQVQEELVRRANLRTNKDGTKRVYSSKYALSSRMYCGKCGDTMRRIAEQSHGKKYPKWKCATRVSKGPAGCDADVITEREIHNAVVRAINKTLGGREDMLEKLKQNVEETFVEQSEAVYEEIDAELVKLQEQLLQRVNANKDYEDIAVEIEHLRDKKQSLSVEDSEREGLKARIQEMREFLEQQTTRIEEYDEQLVIRLIEKITAYDDKFVFQFKSGMTLDLKR